MGSDSNSKAKAESNGKHDRILAVVSILFIVFLLSCLGYWFMNASLPTPNLPTMADRLAFALKWQAFSALTIVVGIMWVANTRLVTPAINPFDENGKKYVEMPTRFLNNTMEQFLIHFVASLTLSTYLPSDKITMLPMLSILFVVARVIFAVGYLIRPVYRAPGFALTSLPTMASLMYSNYRLYQEHFTA